MYAIKTDNNLVIRRTTTKQFAIFLGEYKRLRIPTISLQSTVPSRDTDSRDNNRNNADQDLQCVCGLCQANTVTD